MTDQNKKEMEEGNKQIEELMKPRFKVIASYPNNYAPLGSIVFPTSESNEEFYSRFPHLFKPLQWWEERAEAEMPQYLKFDRDGEYLVKKVTGYSLLDSDIPIFFDGTIDTDKRSVYKGREEPFPVGTYLPATEQEYFDFIQPKK